MQGWREVPWRVSGSQPEGVAHNSWGRVSLCWTSRVPLWSHHLTQTGCRGGNQAGYRRYQKSLKKAKKKKKQSFEGKSQKLLDATDKSASHICSVLERLSKNQAGTEQQTGGLAENFSFPEMCVGCATSPKTEARSPHNVIRLARRCQVMTISPQVPSQELGGYDLDFGNYVEQIMK